MADDTTPAGTKQLVKMSGFQIAMIVTALAVTIAGAAGMAWTWLDQKDDRQHVAAMPEDVRSAVARSAEKDEQVAVSEVETWTHWLSSAGLKIGGSFLGGFALGFAFRTFLKTMAVLTALAVVAWLALSYFQVFNIDFSRVETAWNNNSEWITTQATKLKDTVWTYLPHSSAAFVGFFVGMLRR